MPPCKIPLNGSGRRRNNRWPTLQCCVPVKVRRLDSNAPMKKRVLIVVEGAVAQADFQNFAAGLRHEWDIIFASNSAEAFNALARAPVDAIVTEVRLGGTSGLTLLAEVTQRFPRTQRFILADLNDKISLLKCVGTSHHYIAKPCDARTLKTALERAF